VDILFRTSRLEKECNSDSLLTRRYGPRRAALIRRRLDELRDAVVLEDLRNLPGPRCHELTGDRDEQLSMDLDHPYRLILDVADDPVPRRPDGGLNWAQVSAVRILEVTDTHG
jgi:plasmid maintenance system killer protein